MKVCIVGLGAIGGVFAGWLGSRLAAGEIELSALARGATLAAVQAQGLVLESEEGERVVPLFASDDAAALGVQDLVILSVKSQALADVASSVAALCGPQTQLLSAMNGVPWWFFDGLEGRCAGLRLDAVDPGGRLATLLPAARVIGCVVHLSSRSPAPGRVHPMQGKGLIIGRAVGDGDAALQEVASLLERAGFAVTVSARVQREAWYKLWGNVTMNPVSALTGAPSDRILDDPLVRDFVSAVMLEAQAIGAGFGIRIEQTPQERHAVTRKLGSFKTSMLQDAEAGRTLEIDAIVGAVQEIGRHLGQATPHLDALLGLVRLMARERGLLAPAPAGA